MGNQKLKWTGEEEEALLAGIAKHGPGKWKNILTDPEFAPSLTHRSNIDLKDKWRNLCVNNGGPGSKDKSRTSKGKIKALPPPDNAQNSVTADGSGDAVMADPSTSEVKVKNAPRYNAMIFDALSTIKDTNGCDTSAIVHFVERNYLVPPNIRRVLGTRLRKLVSQGKLEKVQSRYRIRKDTLLGTRSPVPKQKDIRPQKLHNPRLTSGESVVGAATSAASKVAEARKGILLGSRIPIPKQKHIRLQQLQNPRLTSGETLERAATSAASKIAEAENKSYLAADKVKEAERLSKMAEENDTMLQLVKEIYEQCLRGEIFLSA